MINVRKSSIGELEPNNSIVSWGDKINDSNSFLELIPSPISIKIKRDFDYTEFFVKAKGYPIVFYNQKNDTKIGYVIEDYIKAINGKKEIKNTFYFNNI